MTLRMLHQLPALLLLSALTLRGDATTNVVTVSVTPDDTLSDLYFLYAQGDVARFTTLAGNAPAGVTTTFPIDLDIPFPITGVPFFSLIGLYAPSLGTTGVYVAIDNTDAANLIANGTSFDDAFTSFSGVFSPGESVLIAGMENLNSVSIVDAFGSPFGVFGFDIIDPFADVPEQQTPQLFTPIDFTGITDASLVKFSDASPGGSVALSVQPATAAVPEPASMWMLGTALLVWVGSRRVTRKG
jgi:hypothetical protein